MAQINKLILLEEISKRLKDDPDFVRKLSDAEIDVLLQALGIDPEMTAGIMDKLLGNTK